MNMHNRIVVERADEFSMEIQGEGKWTLSRTEKNVIVQMTQKALGLMGQPMPPLRFKCENSVPPRRGLGSSSSAILAGVAAGLAFGGKSLDAPATKKLLLNLAVAEESDKKRMRHARIAPAMYGGLQISFGENKQWITQRVAVPKGLHFVLFIPDDEASTETVREILPPSLTYQDTIFNIARAAMLVNCFNTAQFTPLRFAMEDALHQRHRGKLFAHCEPIIKAALGAGAHGAFLSGAGPTVVAITGGGGVAGFGDAVSDTMPQFLAEGVSRAVHRAADQHGVRGTVHVTEPSVSGLASAGYDSSGDRLW